MKWEQLALNEDSSPKEPDQAFGDPPDQPFEGGEFGEKSPRHLPASGHSSLPRDDRVRSEQLVARFKEYESDLMRFLLALLRDESLAADVLQATCIKLMEHGAEVASGALKSWLFRVAHNAAIERRRRESIERRHFERVASWQVARRAEVRTPADAMIQDERRQEIANAIDALPDGQRDVVRLRVYDNLKFIQIAKALDIPLGTVLTRMRSALQRLRRAVEEFD